MFVLEVQNVLLPMPERGRLGATELLSCAAGLWICASHAMTEQLRDSLQAEGLDEQSFHSEAFAAQPPG